VLCSLQSGAELDRAAQPVEANVNTRRAQDNEVPSPEPQPLRFFWRVCLLSLLSILIEGCSSPSQTSHFGQPQGSSNSTNNRSAPEPREVQSEVMRFADRLISMVDVACLDLWHRHFLERSLTKGNRSPRPMNA
jgi:hypothetical protein